MLTVYRDAFPLVTDVLKHPAFPTAIWALEPTRSGLLPVADGRGGPFKVSWEIHGEGPVRVVVSCPTHTWKDGKLD